MSLSGETDSEEALTKFDQIMIFFYRPEVVFCLWLIFFCRCDRFLSKLMTYFCCSDKKGGSFFVTAIKRLIFSCHSWHICVSGAILVVFFCRDNKNMSQRQKDIKNWHNFIIFRQKNYHTDNSAYTVKSDSYLVRPSLQDRSSSTSGTGSLKVRIVS